MITTPKLTHARVQARRSKSRRGAAFVLIVAMTGVFVITAALTINYSYMQLVRTEMRSATDAAAKAGAEALARTEDVNQATQAAITAAAANRVGGQPLRLSSGDIEFGKVTAQASNKWTFQSGGSVLNAVRINARTGTGTSNSAVPLFFNTVLGKESFTPAFSATAGQQEVDVCLCLDRSGSMLFDMSGTDWVYPPGNPKLSTFTAWGTVWQNHLSPPHPTASRWAIVRDSVDLFLTEAGNYNPPPRTALVTWGSDYTMPIAPGTEFDAASKELGLPPASNCIWSENKSNIQNAVRAKGNVPMMGGTNLSAGLDLAVATLKGTNSAAYKSKVIILMTDGEWNDGRDPILAANDARSQGIVVHTVSMLTTNQTVLQTIASITGGKYIRTTNTAELKAAFVELAHSLPVVLTD